MSAPGDTPLPRLDSISRGGELSALLGKVSGQPDVIRGVAKRWRGTMKLVGEQIGSLAGAVGRVDDAWQGASADAFVTYMGKYGPAATELNDALEKAVTALDKAADELEKARADIHAICEGVIRDAEQYAKDNPDATAADADAYEGSLVETALPTASKRVEDADEKVNAALRAVNELSEHGMTLLAGIKKPGNDEFVPVSATSGTGWVRTPGYTPWAASDTPTVLAAFGGGGSGGYGPSGPPPAGGGPAAPAQVRAWIDEAVAILKAQGYPVSKMNVDDIWMIIQHESGGNPRVVNTWDSNAAKGTPSKGLMQTIDPTFNTWSLPGHKDIYNPVDNIIAGVRYAIARYGSVSAVPGVVGVKTGAGYQGY
ncbi:WXG100 family type VII secretion target [Microtetraspora niveoalba]|uniref:WXG100 family type VII secretion target n=1 Tax=Microtetraspora niveoalba TaxID=46175 RepID=UPI00082B42D5|nr:WXG100 family type VII secretion target [Microtetraspora niveoalba]